ncbi:uncharacterized protein TM35_000321420 [Trypanosoma theileri]|uniref:Uncharacterized protein n=1 Tax=Trypanosoma theileri TaxID=67003 RepID=A0A1X0NMC0_9TRYP|nr:uncharacterized protein TM35_000321420 [Trypanosoma theileri]ORC85827.1 hypothetical protein TM35_000321420 [Trypanosoma theileri]
MHCARISLTSSSIPSSCGLFTDESRETRRDRCRVQQQQQPSIYGLHKGLEKRKQLMQTSKNKGMQKENSEVDVSVSVSVEESDEIGIQGKEKVKEKERKKTKNEKDMMMYSEQATVVIMAERERNGSSLPLSSTLYTGCNPTPRVYELCESSTSEFLSSPTPTAAAVAEVVISQEQQQQQQQQCKYTYKQEKGCLVDTWGTATMESTLQSSMEVNRTTNGAAFAFPNFTPLVDSPLSVRRYSGLLVEQQSQPPLSQQQQQQQVQYPHCKPHIARRYQVTSNKGSLLSKNVYIDHTDENALNSESRIMWRNEHDKHSEWLPLVQHNKSDHVPVDQISTLSQIQLQLSPEVGSMDMYAGHWNGSHTPPPPSSLPLPPPLLDTSTELMSLQQSSIRCQWLDPDYVGRPLQLVHRNNCLEDSATNLYGNIVEPSTQLPGKVLFPSFASTHVVNNEDLTHEEEEEGWFPCVLVNDQSSKHTEDGNNKNQKKNNSSDSGGDDYDKNKKKSNNNDNHNDDNNAAAAELESGEEPPLDMPLCLSVSTLGAYGLASPLKQSPFCNTRDEYIGSRIPTQNESLRGVYLRHYPNSSARTTSFTQFDNIAATTTTTTAASPTRTATAAGGGGESATSANMQMDRSLDALFKVMDVPIEMQLRKERLMEGARPTTISLAESMIFTDSPLNFTVRSDFLQSVSERESVPLEEDEEKKKKEKEEKVKEDKKKKKEEKEKEESHIIENVADGGVVNSGLSKPECISLFTDHGNSHLHKAAMAAAVSAVGAMDNKSLSPNSIVWSPVTHSIRRSGSYGIRDVGMFTPHCSEHTGCHSLADMKRLEGSDVFWSPLRGDGIVHSGGAVGLVIRNGGFMLSRSCSRRTSLTSTTNTIRGGRDGKPMVVGCCAFQMPTFGTATAANSKP